MSYDPLSDRAAQQDTSSAPAYDPLAMVAAGKVLPANSSGSQTPPPVRQAIPENPVNQFVRGAFDQAIQSTGGAIAGGLKGLWDLANGRGYEAAAQDVGDVEQKAAYQPQTGAERVGAETASSDWNPLNWPGVVIGKTGDFLGDTAERLGASPIVSTALTVAPAATAAIYGLRKAGVASEEPVEPEVERVMPKTAEAAPPPDSAPVEGGMSTAAQAERRAILDRVGVVEKRKSAVQGDAQAAATDYQATKFDEPAGRAMSAQFEQERNALAGFTQGLITKAGGSIGMDEDALINRGTTIAKPFDALREWFGQRQKELYAQAQQRSDELAANGNPTAYTQLQSVDRLLKSPDFKNTLLARDQGNLLNAIGAQLDRFREANPNGFTPAGAEQFRQWLNQVWSPDNRWAIGRVKDALDNDVLQQAGEDIYGQARAITQLKAKTLENPNGISSLFDADPQTPINRVTPFERIPDKIMALPAEQFQNLVETLKQMPPELSNEAQAALGEIKGHLLNRLLKAGTETRSGRGAQIWKGEDVSQTLARHAAKFRIAFQDEPEAQAAIKDLNSAGQILRTNEGYPGAYAQAANMSKRGLGSAIVRHIGRAGGAAVGGVAGGGLGAAAGEVAGGAAGEAASSALAERAALKTMRKRIEAPQ